MSGVKGKSGRKRTATNELKKRLEKLEKEELSDIIDALVAVASGAPMLCPHCGENTGFHADIDVQACTYLIDRIMGKPKQQTEISVTEKIVLTADQSFKILARARQAQIEFEQRSLLISPKGNSNEPYND
jgi:hypothetical protein